MKIASVKAIPLTHRARTEPGAGYLFEQPMNFLFVRVETDEELSGTGEGCDSFGCNYPRAVASMIEEAISPLLLGEDPLQVEPLIQKLRRCTRRRLGDQGMVIQAISGLEIALWDLGGQAQGRSISQLLGSVRERVPVYASGTFLEEGSPEWHEEFFRPCLERGVRAIKVRTGTDLKHDLRTLAGLRSLLGDEIRILVDGGEQYELADALEAARALAGVGVSVFEEPIPQTNREAVAHLVRKSPLPIGYGEHLFTLHDFRDCLVHRRADVIQPDAAICGGILEATRIASLAEAFEVPVMPHAVAGPVALAANLHVVGAIRSVGMLEYPFPLNRLWAEMLPEPIFSPSALRDGELAVPDGAGLGLHMDEAVWSRHPYRSQSRVY